jgi:hypothetical protein
LEDKPKINNKRAYACELKKIQFIKGLMEKGMRVVSQSLS